jgi:hypothetical protein
MSDNTDYIKSFIGSRLSASVTGSFAFSQTELDFIESEALELAGSNYDDYKIHTLLKFKALERMWIEVSDAIDHRTDGESFSNSQFASTIEKLYKIAKKDAVPYLPASYGISVQPFEEGFSPYLRSES